MQRGRRVPENSENEFISELFKVYNQMIFRIAFNYLRNNTDAEDVVQEIFVKAINELENLLRIPPKERAFYFTVIAENVSKNALKKQKKHAAEDIEKHYELASDDSLEKTVENKVVLDEVCAVLEEFSDRDYGLIYLKIFRQLQPREIAVALGISEKNIYKYIERAQKRHVKILRERGIEYDI